MGEMLRILNLEDSEIDAELIREKLQEHWPDCLVKSVETEADFIKSLEEDGINLIRQTMRCQVLTACLHWRLFLSISRISRLSSYPAPWARRRPSIRLREAPRIMC
jgi:hypothetical protein